MHLRKTTSLKTLVRSALHPLPGVSQLMYQLEGRQIPAAAHSEEIIEKITPRDVSFKDMSFTFAVIALSARIACLDGSLTRNKYLAFREAFPLKGGICPKIRTLFTLACGNATPYEQYVTHIKFIFPRRMALFTSLVDRLFRIASADGPPSFEAERMLARVAYMLELKPADFSKIRDRHVNPKPHQVLGVDKRIKSIALKQHYREMMRRYHPDRFAGQELSPEVETLLQLKASEINQAYRALSRKAA